MKAVITVIGMDRVGIIAAVSALLAESNSNILDITQTIMDKMFTMIMFVDNSKINITFAELADKLTKEGIKLGVEIRIQHEDIFNSMHRI